MTPYRRAAGRCRPPPACSPHIGKRIPCRMARLGCRRCAPSRTAVQTVNARLITPLSDYAQGGKRCRIRILDKKTGQYQIGRQLGVRREGNLTIPHNFLIEDNYFISWLPVKLLKLWKNHFSPNTFRDKDRVETWKRLIDSLDIDDNPVLIKCKIRNDET